MRERIKPEAYRGVYFDEIRADDLVIMGERPEKSVGFIRADKGMYESLWRLSLETDLGMVIDIRRIPLKQSFIDKCNREDSDPYGQPLGMDIYISHPMPEYHLRNDIAVIGYLTLEKVCKLISGDRCSFLNKEKGKDHE